MLGYLITYWSIYIVALEVQNNFFDTSSACSGVFLPMDSANITKPNNFRVSVSSCQCSVPEREKCQTPRCF